MEPRKKRLSPTLVALVAAALLLAGPALAATPKAPKVDLNRATQKELEELPGVGEATAKKIIAGRPYSRIADLEKAGVPKATIDKIEKLVTVSKPSKKEEPTRAAPAAAAEKPDKKPSKSDKPAAAAAASGPVNLNTASQKELEDLPGVGPATAKKIIAGRPYSSVNDLAKAGVSKSTIGKIGPLVTVGAAAAPPKAAPAAGASTPRSPAPAASKPAPAPTAAATSSSAKASEDKVEAKPGQAPPAKGMVWVNTATKIYHYEGDKWYGNTKEGKYMTEDEAIKAGYRASKEGPKKQ